MYLNYAEYSEFGGTLDSASFPNAERKARRLLDSWTFDRIQALTTIPDIVKECMTELINKMAAIGDGDRVSSFNNGKVSFSFDTSKSEEQELFKTALTYLPVSLISEVLADED